MCNSLYCNGKAYRLVDSVCVSIKFLCLFLGLESLDPIFFKGEVYKQMKKVLKNHFAA